MIAPLYLCGILNSLDKLSLKKATHPDPLYPIIKKDL